MAHAVSVQPTLHVVGGGLAGMAVAWTVARQEDKGGFAEVVLYERDDVLGGKARSNRPVHVFDERGEELDAVFGHRPLQGGWSDHGYHLFPRWYDQVIEVMGEIGVNYRDIIVEGERFGLVMRDRVVTSESPRPRTLALKRSANLIPGLRHEPPTEDGMYIKPSHRQGSMAAMAVTVAFLIVANDETLRGRSVADFLKKRHWFLGPRAQPVYESLLLKALSAEVQDMSALALAKMFRRWTRPIKRLWSHSWSSLNGSLQATFIDPFETALNRVDVRIKTGYKLEHIEFGTSSPLHFEGIGAVGNNGDKVVLALPPGILHTIVEHEKTADAPAEFRQAVKALGAMVSTFSGADVYFFDDPVLTPSDHFGFDTSIQETGVTAYNITPIWKRHEFAFEDATTVLQLVIPDTQPIFDGSIQPDEGALVTDTVSKLSGFVDFGRTKWIVNTNTDSPLSLANAEADEARDRLAEEAARAGFRVAGDYMKSSIGVPSMEAAVGNGRNVAVDLLNEKRSKADQLEKLDKDIEVRLVLKVLINILRPFVMLFEAVAFVLWPLVRPILRLLRVGLRFLGRITLAVGRAVRRGWRAARGHSDTRVPPDR